MKTTYKHIKVRLVEEQPNIEVWHLLGRHHHPYLGKVMWHVEWRQYIFETIPIADLSAACLRDIADFVEQVNEEQKERGKA